MDTTVIYLISVNGEPRYVGSSREHSYQRRINDHLKNDEWLQGVKDYHFEVIDECDEEVKYLNESLIWKEFKSLGYQLMNKRDPANTWPLNSVDRNEVAKIIAAIRRKNGSYKFPVVSKEIAHDRSVKANKTAKENGNKKANANWSKAGGKANKGKQKSDTHKLNIAESRKIMAFARKNNISYSEAKRIWLNLDQ